MLLRQFLRQMSRIAPKVRVAGGLGLCVMLGATATPAQAQTPSFQGPYVGIAPIYGWVKSDVTLTRPGFADTSGSKDLRGPAIGAFAGYDWRIGGSGVVGIVSDIGVTKLGENSRVSAVGTLRGRLGLIVAPDLLLYATGGGSAARQSLYGSLGGVGYDVTRTTGGWIYGAGIETQTHWGAQPVRLGLEVLHQQFSAFDFDAGSRHVRLANQAWSLGVRAAIPLAGGN